MSSGARPESSSTHPAKAEPELSVVVVGRNDGYGGDFVGRLQTCVKALAAGERLTGVVVEVVVVEWNPPHDRPRLGELLPVERPSHVKVVEVPAEVHSSIENHGGLPLFEYLGKNVGVRRASADKILVTNPDVIIFPSTLTLCRCPILEQGGFVRIDRHDFRPPVPRDLPASEVFEAAMTGVFSVNRRPGPKPQDGWSAKVDPGLPVSGWATTRPFESEKEIYDAVYSSTTVAGVGQLHMGMPGDFVLASRDTWDRSHGYWERTDVFIHLDTYHLAQLVASGARQAYAVSPYLILHEDHPRREDGFRDGWEQVVQICTEMMRGDRPLPNPDDWGLRDMELPTAELGASALV